MVAHRAGNDPSALARALALGVDVVELDVHLWRGRLEVRHAKSLGPAPLLWERWWLEDGLSPPPVLEDVLAALADAPAWVPPMVDLKGPDPRLPRAVAAALGAWHPARPLLVCGRVWRNLAPLAGRPGVTIVHSAGTPRELRALLARFPAGAGALEGVSVKRSLLEPALVAALRERTDLVLTWPVDDADDGARLAGWGVTGWITDHPERLAVAAGRPTRQAGWALPDPRRS